MLESADGFSVSFTRQCPGIGSGGGGAGAPPRAPRPRPPSAGGAAPGGGGGGVKMPAGTTSAPTTVACGVESVFRLSHGVDALTKRMRPKASMGSPSGPPVRRPLRLNVIHPTACRMSSVRGHEDTKPRRHEDTKQPDGLFSCLRGFVGRVSRHV